MKILWFTNILLPATAKAMGLPETPLGGWMSALLQALRQTAPDLEFLILCMQQRQQPNFRVKVEGVNYVTFGDFRQTVFAGGVPAELEAEVRQFVQEFNPDVIHVHGTENYFARLSPEALCNKPVLVSLQGIINGCTPYFNGGLAPDELAPFRTLRNRVFHDGVFEIQRRWRQERSVQERVSLACHKHYAGRTNWDRAWLNVLNPRANYYHVDRVIRPEFYNIQRDPTAIRRHSIYCSAAASYPLKGLHWLLRAAAFLKSRYPGIQIRIASSQRILSPPRGFVEWFKDCDYPCYLRHLIRELGITDNVVALPALSACQVVDELRGAHVFCLPSLCENSSNSLCEAMLVGTPSVATYAGGISSILKNREEGILCPIADPAALAAAITELFENDALADRYAAAARESAVTRHESTRIAKQEIEIYQLIRNTKGS
jgi:glycosyltransferase involved in cell wall biosynthesis